MASQIPALREWLRLRAILLAREPDRRGFKFKCNVAFVLAYGKSYESAPLDARERAHVQQLLRDHRASWERGFRYNACNHERAGAPHRRPRRQGGLRGGLRLGVRRQAATRPPWLADAARQGPRPDRRDARDRAPEEVAARAAAGARRVRGQVGRDAAYNWQYSIDQKTWTSLPQTLIAKTGVSGLTTATTYFFRSQALMPKGGESDWGQVVWFLVK